jgi:hypothetical protein
MSLIVGRIRHQLSTARPARRVSLVLLILAAFSMVGTSAWAYWTTIGSGTGSATTSTLAPATSVNVPTTSTGSVPVNWTAPSAPGPVGTLRYYVTRTTGITTSTAGGNCGTATSPITTNVCTDAGVSSGTYTYKVVTLFNSWTSTSAASSPVTVNTAVAAVVTGVSPKAGGTAGGTSVTITGTGFLSATAVSFGATAASPFTIVSDTSITVASPARAAGTIDITVVNAAGTSTTSTADKFTYDGIPTITSVSPKYGPTTGGTSVTITGTGFLSATAVSFGATAASPFTIVSDTSITVASPARAAGTVDITVVNAAGTSTTSTADTFTYDGIPTITSVSPKAGTTTGGTSVTITGTGFLSATGGGPSTVKFGKSANAPSFTVNSDTSITVVSPAGTAGTVDIKVTTSVGNTTAANAFTYDGTPTITSVSPNTGTTAGGTPVTITGTGFLSATTVNFGATAASPFTIVSDTSITVASPAGAAGTVGITVVNAAGFSNTSTFTYN